MTAPFVAARAVGATVARVLWLVLWGSLAYFALTPANRAPQALHDMIAGMANGEPGWLAILDKHAAALVAHQGLAASIVLAVAFAVVAIGVYLPPSLARATLILGIVVAAVIWVFGEAFGGILIGGATDPNSGPLLALLALAYWPLATATATPRPLCRGPPAAGRRTTRRDVGMSIPAWILDIFAAVMLLVAAVSAGQLGVAHGGRGRARGTPTSPAPIC